MSQIAINFGKYKNEPIDEIYEKDRDYLLWLCKQKTLSCMSDDVRNWLDEKFGSVDKSYVVSFGKSRGKTINWIFGSDPKYFDWLAKSEFVTTNIPQLKAEIDALIDMKNSK